jgi:MSHA biogenesis protein MshQ
VSNPANPFQLTAPGTGNDGSVLVTLNGVAPYLQFPWGAHCGGNGIPCGPQARASFGLYRGNDRVIYWRELVRP